MVKRGNGRVKYMFKLTLFKLGCLCWSVWDVVFNDETFFFKSGSQKVYTNLDIDLSANISVIGFQIEIIIC